MKKTLCLFVIFLIFSLFIQTLTPFAAPPSEAPKAAVEKLMDGIKNWDAEASASILGEAVPNDYLVEICTTVAPAVLSKLEYEIGNSKIEGNKATVDISITAADIKELTGDIMSQAIGLAAIQKLLGLPVDVEDFVFKRLSAALDDKNLTTIRTDASVYLILGGDGTWNLDMTEIKNLEFLEAVSGGMADFESAISAFLSNR